MRKTNANNPYPPFERCSGVVVRGLELETHFTLFCPAEFGQEEQITWRQPFHGCESQDVQTPRSQQDSDQDSSTGPSGPMPIGLLCGGFDYWLFVAVGLDRFPCFFFFFESWASLRMWWSCSPLTPEEFIYSNYYIQFVALKTIRGPRLLSPFFV